MNLNIKNIVSSIRGMFLRTDDLREAMQNTQQQMLTATSPAVAEALHAEKKVDLSKNVFAIELKRGLNRNWKGLRGNASLFAQLDEVMLNLVQINNTVIGELNNYFSEVADKDQLDYARLQAIALAQNVDTAQRYIRRAVRYIVLAEIASVTKRPLSDFMSPAQIKFIENKGSNAEFLNTMVVLGGIKVEAIPAMMRKIPAAKPDANGKSNGLHSERVVDPTGALNNFSMSAAIGKPLYLVMMAVVDYQHSKYKLAQEELFALRIELDFLQSVVGSGQGDAAIERQAEQAQERIDKLEYECARYEEKALGTSYA